jgi:hypothetical protein
MSAAAAIGSTSRFVGPCSDTELVLIERLAQAIDDRPVIVRRARQAPAATVRTVANVD